MINIIYFNQKRISYHDSGKGFPVVLLHGYLESALVWEKFSVLLSSHFRVISIDLPGHGNSETAGSIHTMEFLADAVNHVLESVFIDKCFIAGHSLGGYVVLALFEKYKHKFIGLCLFHSNPWNDTAEKIEKRNREKDLVNNGKLVAIANINIPLAFADKNKEKFREEIRRCISIALRNEANGVIAMLEGMKLRKDQTKLLSNIDKPVLLILGRYDNYMPFTKALGIKDLSGQIELLVLENSGHMGFIEEKAKSIAGITAFIGKIMLDKRPVLKIKY